MSEKKSTQPKLVEPTPETTEEAGKVTPITKPTRGSIQERFKSQRAATGVVETLPEGLPYHSISQAKDFVRLHPDEENYWSIELAFVRVPIKGVKSSKVNEGTLHLINEALAIAMRVPPARILHWRLALATKPYDIFFLCQIPTRNEDNTWNISNLEACTLSKTEWVQVTSLKAEGYEKYRIDNARSADAFPEPRWPTQTLDELLDAAFPPERSIESEDHPALLRLLGIKPPLS